MKSILRIIVITSLLTISCAKVYYSPDAEVLANNHSVIAISPPVVSIAANKNVDAEALIEQQKTESANFQNEIYSWMLKRKTQGRFTQDFQDLLTN